MTKTLGDYRSRQVVRGSHQPIHVTHHRGPFLPQTPLTFRQIYTIATPFVVSCPADLNILGYSDPFLSLKVTLNNSTATFDFEQPAGSGPLYAAFIQGNPAQSNGTQFAPIDSTTGEVIVPLGLKGYVFAIVTSASGEYSDDVTVAGPAILDFPYDSTGAPIAP